MVRGEVRWELHRDYPIGRLEVRETRREDVVEDPFGWIPMERNPDHDCLVLALLELGTQPLGDQLGPAIDERRLVGDDRDPHPSSRSTTVSHEISKSARVEKAASPRR